MSFTFQPIRSKKLAASLKAKLRSKRVGPASFKSDLDHSLAPAILVRVSHYERRVFNTYESKAGRGGAGTLRGFSLDCAAADAGGKSRGRPLVAGPGCVGYVDAVRSFVAVSAILMGLLLMAGAGWKNSISVSAR